MLTTNIAALLHGRKLRCTLYLASHADVLRSSSRVPAPRTNWISDICEQWNFRFSRRSWGGNAWRTPKNVCDTLYPSWINVRVFTFFEGKFSYNLVNSKAAVFYYMTVWFSFFSHPDCAALLKTRIVSRGVVLLYIDDPNDRFLQPAEIRKRNVAMNIYERSRMAITWLSYVVVLCKLYLHKILPSLRESLSIPHLFWLTQFTVFFSRYFKFDAHTSWYAS